MISQTTRRLIYAASASAIAVAAVPALGQDVQFVNVADDTGAFAGVPTNPLQSFQGASINDAGQVAFVVGRRSAGGSQVTPAFYAADLGTAGTVLPLLEPQEFFLLTRSGFETSINASGTVSFGLDSTNLDGIYTADAAVADSATRLYAASDVGPTVIDTSRGTAINDGGIVAFGFQATGDQGVAAGDGGTPTIVVQDTFSYGRSSINNGNRVASVRSGSRIVTADLDSGDAAQSVPLPTAFGSLSSALVDDSDDITFYALREPTFANPVGPNGIYRTDVAGNVMPLVVDDGPFDMIGTNDNFNGDRTGFSVSDAGDLAFLATTDLDSDLALFLGTDPIDDRLIGVGDPLFGGTVTGLNLGFDGLSDAGTVAFGYALDTDGDLNTIEVRGIAVAAIPEPASAGLLFAAGAGLLIRRRR